MITPIYSSLNTAPENSTPIVLMPIGGQATRAAATIGTALPKTLIELDNGLTVFDTICQGLQAQGFEKFVFCLGHLSEVIIDHIKQDTWRIDRTVDYELSVERIPLGVDGAILQAISSLSLQGDGLVMPGDMLMPWQSAYDLSVAHQTNLAANITLGVTSLVTEHTTDVGKFVSETASNRLIKCYGRNDAVPPQNAGMTALTSAAVTAINLDGYSTLCAGYTLGPGASSQERKLSLRDDILPWAVADDSHASHGIYVFDIKTEILDMGTAAGIAEGLSNWRHYVGNR